MAMSRQKLKVLALRVDGVAINICIPHGAAQKRPAIRSSISCHFWAARCAVGLIIIQWALGCHAECHCDWQQQWSIAADADGNAESEADSSSLGIRWTITKLVGANLTDHGLGFRDPKSLNLKFIPTAREDLIFNSWSAAQERQRGLASLSLLICTPRTDGSCC